MHAQEPEHASQLGRTLRRAIEEYGIAPERLSQISGVPENYVTFLLEDRLEKLPAAPYVRGYLMRIAAIVRADGETLWREYLKHASPTYRGTGASDTMPKNRFLTGVPARLLLVSGALGIVALVFGLRSFYVHNPRLEFANLSDALTVAGSSPFVIRGRVNREYKLTLNNEEVVPKEDGTFEKEVMLEPGANSFLFKAKKLLGREYAVERRIVYNAPTSSESAPRPLLLIPVSEKVSAPSSAPVMDISPEPATTTP